MSTEGAAIRTTIVIPAWGAYAGDGLAEALASIAAQDRGATVIVVDNASDAAVTVPEGVEVLRSERRLSLGATRNLGLEQSDSAYVMFWDADDTMLPGTLAFLEDALDRDPRLVAYGAAIIEPPDGVRHRWPRRWIALLVRVRPLLALIDCVWSVFPTTGATLISADAARRAGGFSDADSGDDWCLGAALVWQGRFGWSERAGRAYLRRAGSIWDTHASARHQVHHAAIVRTRLRQDGVAPAWLRRLLPALACAQWAAVAAHLLVAAVRRRHRRR